MRREKLSILVLLLPLLAACAGGVPEIERVVVVTFDTTRADRFGCYGFEEDVTPNVDALAREAVLFEQAVSPVPTTLPSHSTMFTGLYPQDHGVRFNLVFRLGPDVLTLAEVLGDEGFATAAFPATLILSKRFGIDQGFDTWVEPPHPEPGSARHADETTRRAGENIDLALEWLDEHREGKSFSWVHFYDPHAPYRPPFPFSSRFRDRPYLGEIAYADSQLGRLLEYLRSDPAWERTLVVIAGDHGEGLHDHGERFHSYLIYETTQRVPLIIRAPGATAGRVGEPVGLADLMPTVLDLAGLEPPREFRGISLRPALEGGDLPRRDLYAETHAGTLNYGWTKLHAIRHGPWKLIDSPQPELYDLESDPGETVNLASVEVDRLEDLRASLQELMPPLGDTGTAVEAEESLIDPEHERMLASLGYVGGTTGGEAEQAPHPLELVDMASEMITAQRAVAAGDWPYLEELCRYVLERDVTNRWGYKNLIRALIEQDRAREAQDHGAKLVEIYPEDEDSYISFAQTYKAQGLHDEATRVLETGRKVVPDSTRLLYLSLVEAFEAGHPGVCAERVPAALEEAPDSPLILIQEARCHARAGAPEAALASIVNATSKGFRTLRVLRESEELAEVVQLPQFGQLVDLLDPEPDEGS